MARQSLTLLLIFLTGRAFAQGPCFQGVKSLAVETKSQPGVTWQCSAPGVQSCDVTGDVYKVADETACYNLAFSMYETRCALFRPRDSTCHLKLFTCDDPRLNIKTAPDGEFTAITICFHCHKTPQWWLDTQGTAKFDFQDKPDKIVKWTQADASCTCTDQRGWICDWDCGDGGAQNALAATGADCSGTHCASADDACVYTAATPSGEPTWLCVPRSPLTDDFCRTYNAAEKTWDGDSPMLNTCSWYPGRKQCGGYIGALPPADAVVLNDDIAAGSGTDTSATDTNATDTNATATAPVAGAEVQTPAPAPAPEPRSAVIQELAPAPEVQSRGMPVALGFLSCVLFAIALAF